MFQSYSVVATTIEITTTIDIIISIVVENEFQTKHHIATTIEITTTIEIISIVVENAFKTKHHIATTNEITTTIEIIISIEVENAFKTSTNCNGHRYRFSPNIPPSLNGSHSLFLVDYKIHIEYIYYK